jgi:ubiquinone/menaquinone biosynthesis C-methylase UbiE
VVEHVANPAAVVAELYRVIEPGGHLIARPFLQPEHKVPTDFQRYTRDGLIDLLTDFGFSVTEIIRITQFITLCIESYMSDCDLKTASPTKLSD